MKSHRTVALWLVCFATLAAWAQTDVSAKDDAQGQRQRIATERSRAEADFSQKEQACYSRFAVQGCLDQIASQRRVQERELKRQEALLNAADRRQRAQEQLQSSAEKKLDFEAHAEELAPDATAERLQAQQEKVQAHRDVRPSPSNASSKPLPTAPTAAEQASLREAYLSKQRVAQERKLARDKRLRESKEKSPVLPVPN